ncbi:MAG TPA: tetratricopeptide repeat protein [Candidatus Sulfotelmatobacter sp.]|nr:tetratricopeptide repeat protein [Candidatus Sulfotelmatobacter sp.]
MRASAELRLVEPRTDRRYSLREAAGILEVPEARLRALARAGFLAPQRGPIGPLSFGFQDLLLLRTTKGLLESGVSMRRIRSIWASLREQLAADLPLTSISIHTDGNEVVASDGSARWRPDSGQFLLNFDASEIAERSAARAAPAPRAHELRSALSATEADRPLTADHWYELGCELEASSVEEAGEAYAHALDLDPSMAEAHVNLGRLFHIAGELGRAEPHYRDAVRVDPDNPTPHFNLGVLLEELGRRDEAVHAYRQAILRDPDFADAHCNLGLLLESLGRRQEAVRHLMAARKLSGEADAQDDCK